MGDISVLSACLFSATLIFHWFHLCLKISDAAWTNCLLCFLWSLYAGSTRIVFSLVLSCWIWNKYDLDCSPDSSTLFFALKQKVIRSDGFWQVRLCYCLQDSETVICVTQSLLCRSQRATTSLCHNHSSICALLFCLSSCCYPASFALLFLIP